MTALFHLEVEEGSYNFFFITVTFYHSMGTCAAQLTCLRKVCGHVIVIRSSTVKTGRVQCKLLCLYVVVSIANEDKKLQTPADIIPLYARKI